MSPYIKKEERRLLAEYGAKPSSAGQLNYLITRLILEYLDRARLRDDGKIHYSDYNEVVGVLECVKQELYRRKIAEYEEVKCALNGDVYE